MLPLVQRELRVAARSPKLYRNRLLLGLAVVLIGAAALSLGNPNHPVKTGGAFSFFSFLALLFCLAEGLRRTADSISEEKREGTLGFLFLSGLSGFDVLAGKITGAAIRGFNGLLAFLPLLAISLLLGGVTLGEFWRSALALILALLLSLTLCAFVSVISREKSLHGSALLLLIFAALPYFASAVLERTPYAEYSWVGALSPAYLTALARESHYLPHPDWYWIGAGSSLAASFAFTALGSLLLPRVWQEKPRRAIRPATRRRRRTDEARRARQLDRNPILWLAWNPSHARFFSITFYSIAITLLAIRVIMQTQGLPPEIPDYLALFLLTLLLSAYLASQSSMNLAEARRSGALELLLSTPLKQGDIIRGQLLAIRGMFLWPALLLLLWYLFAAWRFTWGSGYFDFRGLFLLIPAADYLTTLCAIPAVGMWMGLTSSTPNRALFKTLFWTLVLPRLLCVPPTIVCIVLFVIGIERARGGFRRFVSERYLQGPGFMLAPVAAPAPAAAADAPPVIR